MSASQQALSLQSEVVISHWVSSTCSCVYSIDTETQLVTTSSQAALAACYRAKTPSAISRQFFVLLKAPPTPAFFHKHRHLTKNTGNAKRKILCRWYTWNELFCKRRLHLYISTLTFFLLFTFSDKFWSQYVSTQKNRNHWAQKRASRSFLRGKELIIKITPLWCK